MTRKEIQILTRYSKLVGMDKKYAISAYEKGDSTQREVDLFALMATFYIQKAVKEGRIKLNKKGEVLKTYRKKYDEVVQEFIKSQKKVPKFFITPLPFKLKVKMAEDKDGDKEKR